MVMLEMTGFLAAARERPERARRRVRRKAAAVEVFAQLPLDVVGEACAMLGDETPGLLLGVALLPTLDSRKKAPENALPRARRCVRLRHATAAQLRIPIESHAAHGLAFHD